MTKPSSTSIAPTTAVHLRFFPGPVKARLPEEAEVEPPPEGFEAPPAAVVVLELGEVAPPIVVVVAPTPVVVVVEPTPVVVVVEPTPVVVVVEPTPVVVVVEPTPVVVVVEPTPKVGVATGGHSWGHRIAPIPSFPFPSWIASMQVTPAAI